MLRVADWIDSTFLWRETGVCGAGTILCPHPKVRASACCESEVVSKGLLQETIHRANWPTVTRLSGSNENPGPVALLAEKLPAPANSKLACSNAHKPPYRTIHASQEFQDILGPLTRRQSMRLTSDSSPLGRERPLIRAQEVVMPRIRDRERQRSSSGNTGNGKTATLSR